MEKPSYQWFGQMSAAIGVIISLSFVAYELKLSRDIAVAELTLSNFHQSINYRISLLDIEAYERGIDKLRKDETLNAEEAQNLHRVIAINFLLLDSSFLLYELGLQPEGEWQVTRELMKWRIAGNAFWREAAENTAILRPSLAKELEAIIKEIDAEEK